MTQFIFIPEMGCSGDMILGALADLGAEDEIRSSVGRTLGIGISFKDIFKKGIRAKTLEMCSAERYSPQRMMELIRSAADILEWEECERRFAWDTFETILEAERSIHGLEEVHLHEIGYIDTAVDIVGATVGLSSLGAFDSEVISAPIAIGAEPAPAAIRILKSRKFDFYAREIKHELCTPTGASILVNIAQRVCKPPEMVEYKEGCGGGRHNFSFPNILRVRIL
jgi:uncharacterized protein (DUF111 family)